MKAEFYEVDGKVLENEEWKDGKILMFRMEAPSKADKNAQPFIFDGPATERQKKDYKSLLEEFLKGK